MVIEAEGKGGGIAWLRYRRKITNIVSYITVKIQRENGNRNGKRMITKNEAKIRKAEIELKEKKGGIIVSNCKTLEDLINEYVELYGKDRWALSTYDGNMSLLKNYILPIIRENSTDGYQYQISGDLL